MRMPRRGRRLSSEMPGVDEQTDKAAPVRLWLALDPGEPLSGTVGDERDADGRQFSGWLELMTLIEVERLKHHPSW